MQYHVFNHKEDVMRKLAFYCALAVVLGCGLSAGAAENSPSEFYAVSQVEASAANLNIMPDSELTKVEGMSVIHYPCGCWGGYSSSYTSIYQSNSMGQANVNYGGKHGGDVSQGNFALQGNLAIVR